jgi:hypothetical protein
MHAAAYAAERGFVASASARRSVASSKRDWHDLRLRLRMSRRPERLP